MAAKQLLFYDFLRSSNLDRTAPSRKTENMSTNESHFRQVETLNYRKGGFHPVHLQDQFKKDRYRVIHKLGHGGFATVWLARDVVRHRYVALKILAARLSRDCPEVEILRRLKRGIDLKGKAHVMSMLDHFWISGPNGKHLCVVSEVAGPSIKQFNECPGQWSGSRRLKALVARKVALQVTEGLAYIHSTGTVHGDFTSANILLQLANIDEWSEAEIYERLGHPETTTLHRSSESENNLSTPRYTIHAISMKEVDPQWLSDQIMIIDFGIAFLQEQSSPDIGTPKSYCAPEFLFHSPRSVSSDIWALGCAIFEIRTGSPLFQYSGRPSRTQALLAMVTILGTLPDKWWVDWEEGVKWYATHTKTGGDLADIIQGTLYTRIMDIGIHDGDYHPAASSHIGDSPREGRGDDSENGITSRMVALVGELTTSEAEDVIAEAYRIDTKSSSASGSSTRTTSGSSNAKSGEKSISSEGISTEVAKDNLEATTSGLVVNLNLIGDDNVARMPLDSVEELPEPSAVQEFLELSGTRITITEALVLESLLRSVLKFLPEERLGPSELAKHHWFVDSFPD